MTKDPYIKQLKDFLNMMQGRLAYAWDEQDNENDAPIEKLYGQSFTLSFMGKSCKLDFGAIEYQNIEQMLQDTINELEL